jgi:hypothetical protein
MEGLKYTYVCLQRVRHVVEEDCSDQHPNFKILESFKDLILFVMNVLHASLVGLETLDSNNTFTLCEKFGCVGRIGEDPP